MKQTSIFSYVMWSEIITTAKVRTVISNVVQMQKRHLIWTRPNVIQLPKLENVTTHIWDMGPFCQILNVADIGYSRNARTESLIFLLFNFCNNGLHVEVSNNEIFDILTSNSSCLKGSITNTKVCQGFHDDKKVGDHWPNTSVKCHKSRNKATKILNTKFPTNPFKIAIFPVGIPYSLQMPE